MASGIGNLPFTPTYVSPFDVITSQAENETQDNISALADGSGIGDGAITTAALGNAAITLAKIDLTTVPFGHGLVVKASNQTSSGTSFINTQITFPSSFNDSSSNSSSLFTMTGSSEINIVKTGKYKVTVTFLSEVTGSPKLYKNGSPLKDFGYATAGDHAAWTYVHVAPFTASDKITLWADQSSASRIYYGGTGTGPYISMLIEPMLS